MDASGPSIWILRGCSGGGGWRVSRTANARRDVKLESHKYYKEDRTNRSAKCSFTARLTRVSATVRRIKLLTNGAMTHDGFKFTSRGNQLHFLPSGPRVPRLSGPSSSSTNSSHRPAFCFHKMVLVLNGNGTATLLGRIQRNVSGQGDFPVKIPALYKRFRDLAYQFY
jgi:hypothetical protein